MILIPSESYIYSLEFKWPPKQAELKSHSIILTELIDDRQYPGFKLIISPPEHIAFSGQTRQVVALSIKE